jgi:hypothetical protein
MEVKKASQRDKDYMRRLGEFNREGRMEWLHELQALTIDERLRRTFLRTERGAPYLRREPEDLAAIYTRARRLGLYRG